MSDAGPDDKDFDPFLDDMDDDWDEAEDEPAPEPVPAEQEKPKRPPLWSLGLDLNNGEYKEIVFYNQMYDEPQSLYWSLMEWYDMELGESDDE